MNTREPLVVLLFCAQLAAAAPARKPAPAGPGNPYWLKIYSTSPYAEIWTGDLALKDFDGGLPKALKAIEARGGTLTQPLETFVSSKKDKLQQLSFEIARGKTKELVKDLRKLGELPEPGVRPNGTPIPVKEVRAKIDLLTKEKREQAEALRMVPSVAAAVDEILAHLLLVDAVAGRVEPQVRFNLTLRQK